MKFELPTYIKVKLYPKNTLEKCFILGALVGQGYRPIVENETIVLCLDIENVEEFKIQMECLEADLKHFQKELV